jgi:hypothetical protein
MKNPLFSTKTTSPNNYFRDMSNRASCNRWRKWKIFFFGKISVVKMSAFFLTYRTQSQALDNNSPELKPWWKGEMTCRMRHGKVKDKNFR